MEVAPLATIPVARVASRCDLERRWWNWALR